MQTINICFITQIYDDKDPYRSNVVEWIKKISLNSKVNNVHILTRYKSEHAFDNKCSISSIQSRFKLIRLIKFYIEIFKQVSRNSIIFIHMGGPYSVNLFLFKLFFNTKVYQWWAHPIIGLSTRLGFFLSVDKLFTCTESSFPIKSNKKVVIGHGVNIKRFPLRNKSKSFKNSLVTASRLTYRKNIHKMINLIHFMHENNMGDIFLTIYGSPLSYKDDLYEKYLNEIIKNTNLDKFIRILPAIEHSKLHSFYENHNLYLNFSETALDKSVLEAMSTGIPILSCNECLAEIIKDEKMIKLNTFNRNEDLAVIAEKVKILINLDNLEFDKYKIKSHELIKSEHSIEKLTNTIINKIHKETYS